MVDVDGVVHRRVFERRGDVEIADLLRQPISGRAGAIVHPHRTVGDHDRLERHGASGALAIRFLPLLLHEPSDIPALLATLQLEPRLIEMDTVEHDPLRHDLEDVVVDLDILQRDDALARDIDRHV